MKANREIFFTGICYVTFETKEIAHEIVDMLGSKVGFLRRLFGWIGSSRTIPTKFGNTRYTLKEATSPSDINWKNQGASACSMLVSRIGTFLLSLVMLAISFFLILGLKSIQKQMAEKMRNNREVSFSTLSFRALSVVITLVVMIINMAISMGI